MGSSAWAYDVPDGYEVKKVFIGTNNGDNTVTAEDYESAESVDARWAVSSTCGKSHALKSIQTITNVPLAVGANAYDGENYTIPTYVGGKTLALHGRGSMSATFSFDPISTGYLVFSSDGFSGVGSFGEDTNDIYSYEFQDAEGNTVWSFGFASGSGNQTFKMSGDNSREFSSGEANTIYSTNRSRYQGYSIKEMVINMATGEINLTLDFVNDKNIRKQVEVKKSNGNNYNIGTGKTIAKLKVSKPSRSQAECTAYLDNMVLYSVGVDATHNYTIKATTDGGSTELSKLAEGTCKEDLDYSITGIPYVVEKSGKFYVLDDASVTSYGKTFTMGNADQTQNINYTYDASIVYFNDAGSSTWPSDQATASGGKIGSWGSNNNILSITPGLGVYRVDIYVWSKSGSGSNYRGEALSVNGEVKATFTGNSNGIKSNYVLVPAEGTLAVYGAGTSKATDNIDYVIVRKVYDVAGTVVGDANYTTDYNTVFSEDMTLTDGTKYKVNFQNHGGGTNNNENFHVFIKNGGENKAIMRADWWDDVAKGNGGFTDAYKYSADGGSTTTAIDWATFCSDLKDANVDLTITYTSGTVTVEGTATKDNHVYYYNFSNGAGALTGDVTVNLSVNKAWLDVISVEKNVIASIGEYGYRTFSSAYDLDFTNVEGLTAYIATSSDDSYVTLTEIEKVPAETGLVLKGAEGTYDIPVTDSYTSSDWPSGKTNYLVKCLAETTVEASPTGTNYVLSVQNETVVFAPIGGISATVKAGGAYLYIPTGVGAKLRLVFGDEDATAINGIESEKNAENGAIYNLAGQRVGKDYKGIVIKNGKKFMNK